MAQKYAIRKLKRGEDGTMSIIYVDASTGEQLQSTEGYIVYSAAEAEKAGLNISDAGTNTTTNATEDDEEDKETSAERVIKSASEDDGEIQTPARSSSSSGLLDRSYTNNYGYINTPDWLGMAGFLPVVGGAAKAADRVAGANNTIATGNAREDMGLETGGLGAIGRAIGNVLGLRDESMVANVKIGDNPYAVGLEATNALGQTTLTPQEAQARAAMAGVPLEELSRSESNQFRQDFKDTGLGNTGGLLGTLFSNVREAASNLFSPGSNSGLPDGWTEYDSDSYPDAPGGYTGDTWYTDNPFGASGGSDSGSSSDSSNSNSGSDSSSTPSGLEGWNDVY